MPSWNGNEFLLPDGRRPTIRTLHAAPRRPRRPRARPRDRRPRRWGRVRVGGARPRPATPAAISGPGRGYTIDHDAPAFLLAGDETAIPAISQLLEVLPADDAGAGAHRGRPPRRAAPAARSSRRDRRVVRPAAGRGARRCARRRGATAPTSAPAPGCGRPAKRPRCSASAATLRGARAARAAGHGARLLEARPQPATPTRTPDGRRRRTPGRRPEQPPGASGRADRISGGRAHAAVDVELAGEERRPLLVGGRLVRVRRGSRRGRSRCSTT